MQLPLFFSFFTSGHDLIEFSQTVRMLILLGRQRKPDGARQLRSSWTSTHTTSHRYFVLGPRTGSTLLVCRLRC